jgi:hypothetical protein
VGFKYDEANLMEFFSRSVSQFRGIAGSKTDPGSVKYAYALARCAEIFCDNLSNEKIEA